MRLAPTDFKRYMIELLHQERDELGLDGVHEVLDRGRKWKLPSLQQGGSAFFPHAALPLCGHHTAAVVHACLDAGADQILALGVLHLLNDHLRLAREEERAGDEIFSHPLRGIQGASSRSDWKSEYSLSNFSFLLDIEAKRRGIRTPKLITRYPFLVGGRPETLPGIEELESLVKDSLVVATADLVHHGVGYLTPPDEQIAMADAYPFALEQVQKVVDLLATDRYLDYRQQSLINKSDAQDGGQVLRYLLGPLKGAVHDMVLCDTTYLHRSVPPNWVAASLVELSP